MVSFSSDNWLLAGEAITFTAVAAPTATMTTKEVNGCCNKKQMNNVLLFLALW